MLDQYSHPGIAGDVDGAHLGGVVRTSLGRAAADHADELADVGAEVVFVADVPEHVRIGMERLLELGRVAARPVDVELDHGSHVGDVL